MMASGTHTDSSWSDPRPILDEELSRLQEKYRAPLILCYLEGKTNIEAGRMLGWPAGSPPRSDMPARLLECRM
jgi:DNA-directed RNA polymerase specialized sigma24 family protein